MPDPAETSELVPTRLALHAVAELVLAGSQHHASGSIRLRVTPNGFATVGLPSLRVVGTDLLAPDDLLHPIVGTARGLGGAIGVGAGRPGGGYGGGSGGGAAAPLVVGGAAPRHIADAFAL